jgi:hypothetical protein
MEIPIPAFIDARRQFVGRWRQPERQKSRVRRISDARRAASAGRQVEASETSKILDRTFRKIGLKKKARA